MIRNQVLILISYLSSKFLDTTECLHIICSLDFLNISIPLKVMSLKFPIGVETIYSPLLTLLFLFSVSRIITSLNEYNNNIKMNKIIKIILFFVLVFLTPLDEVNHCK